MRLSARASSTSSGGMRLIATHAAPGRARSARPTLSASVKASPSSAAALTFEPKATFPNGLR